MNPRTPLRTPAIPVLYGKNHYDIGAAAARRSGPKIRAMTSWLARRAKSDPGGVERLLAEAHGTLRRVSERSPENLAELEGLSRALNIGVSDLVCARLAAESSILPFCTNFGAAGLATADGNPVVSWNFDVPPIFRLFMGRFPLYVRHLEGTNPYVCLGVPALFGIGILNSRGLCTVVNAVSMTEAGDGLSPFELNNIAMETCSTVDEAEEVFASGPRKVIRAMSAGILMNWNTIWADAGGALSVFECSHSHFHRERAGDEGIIASANHHQFLDRALSGCSDPATIEWLHGSYSRLARMWALLREHHGRIDPRVAKRIISDHIPDYSTLGPYGVSREWWDEKLDDSTICAHAWNWKKHLLAGEVGKMLEEAEVSWTVYSLQVQPGSMTVWFTDGHPCRNPTTPICFGEALGADAGLCPGALLPGQFGRERSRDRRSGMFRSGMSPLETLLTRVWTGFIDTAERYAAHKSS